MINGIGDPPPSEDASRRSPIPSAMAQSQPGSVHSLFILFGLVYLEIQQVQKRTAEFGIRGCQPCLFLRHETLGADPGVLWGIGVAVGVSLIMIVHDAAVPRR